jgi:membrane-associated phospholipid phosphatase
MMNHLPDNRNETRESALRIPWVLLILLAGIAAAGLLVLDHPVADWVHAHAPRKHWLHETGDRISWLGLAGWYAVPPALLFGWWKWIRPHRRWAGFCAWLLGAQVLSALAVRILKIFFGRWRPDQPLGGTFDFFSLHAKRHSFPSGHTCEVAAVMTVLWFVAPRLRPVYVCWAILMAAARMLADQHFLSDAAAGAIVGIVCALAWRRMQKRGFDPAEKAVTCQPKRSS